MMAKTVKVDRSKAAASAAAPTDDDSYDSCRNSIADFYRERCVLVTGATGFLGKVLVEKLLRSLPGIRTVYLLMRPKRGQDVRRRLENMLSVKLFENMKKEQPELLTKLVAVQGDLTQPSLGIGELDERTLVENVSIVFHSAATVRFDDPLKLAVQMNVVGTQELLKLCHKMTKLVSLVHVSTAFSNCDRDEIDETIHKPKVHPQNVIESVKWMNDEMIDTMTPKLLGAHPNTYTYTKQMAEYLLQEECGSLPVAIVRPSITTAAWKEPLPGWIDNINGPTGFILAIGKGLVHCVLCNKDNIFDVVPVDIPINLMIAVGWYTATHRPNSVMVYNCTSGSMNKVTWGESRRDCLTAMVKYPLNNAIWYPGGDYTTNRLYFKYESILLHYLPAIFLDLITRLAGKKPITFSIQQKIHKALESFEFFRSHEFLFHNDNLKMLCDKVPQQERDTFFFDIRHVSWPEYWHQYFLGGKLYVLKEDMSTLPAARKHLQRMKAVYYAFTLLKLWFAWFVVTSCSSTACLVWDCFVALFSEYGLSLLPIRWNS